MERTQVSSSTTKVTLKLLIDKSSERVLFAEAGKDFVDFLFGLLQLPVGAILSCLVEPGMGVSWSIGKVYNAVKSIDPLYFQTNQTKISLLNPKCHTSTKNQSPLLGEFGSIGQASSPPSGLSSSPAFGVSCATASGAWSTPASFGASSTPAFGASSSSPFGSSPFGASSTPAFGASSTSTFGASCTPAFGGSCATASGVSSSLPLQEPVAVDGYVKVMTTYMVMDDLTVEPMSTISTIITILNRFQVRDVRCLQEKTIEIDMEKALKLVKASFESITVLTDVLLKAEQTKAEQTNVVKTVY